MKSLVFYVCSLLLICKGYGQSPIVSDYSVSKHSGIGERYINHTLDISLDYTNPVLVGEFSDSLKWEMEFYRVDTIQNIDQEVLTHFHWPDQIDRVRLLYYSPSDDLEAYYNSVENKYKEEYAPLGIRESKISTLPQNRWFAMEFFDNLSGQDYSCWEFFYKVPNYKGIVRYNYFGPSGRDPINSAISNGMDQIMSLITSEGERFKTNPFGYLQESLLRDNFYPYQTIASWERLSDSAHDYDPKIYECLSLLYSFSGDFKKNRESIEQKYQGDNSELTVNTTGQIYVADDFIIEKAKKAKVLGISEHHYYPRSRKYITNLLERLYNLGYTTLALEALSGRPNRDYYELGDIKRGIGYYTNDYNYANLLREAQRLGFKIVSYESASKTEENRDFKAYNNLLKIVDNELEADEKLLIICGHAHTMKQPQSNGKKWLGYYLDQKFGSEFVAIYAAQFKELDPKTYVQLIAQVDPSDDINNQQPTTLIQRDHDLKFDGVVLYPPTTYDAYGVPDWYHDDCLQAYNLSHINESSAINYIHICRTEDVTNYGEDAIPVFVYRSNYSFDMMVNLTDDDYVVFIYSDEGVLNSSYSLR